MEEFAKVLSNYGFPIAVSAFLLFRMEGKLQTLCDLIKELIIKLDSKKAKV